MVFAPGLRNRKSWVQNPSRIVIIKLYCFDKCNRAHTKTACAQIRQMISLLSRFSFEYQCWETTPTWDLVQVKNTFTHIPKKKDICFLFSSLEDETSSIQFMLIFRFSFPTHPSILFEFQNRPFAYQDFSFFSALLNISPTFLLSLLRKKEKERKLK